MPVTVPGSATPGTPNITVAPGTGDVLQLAAQIGALLATVQGAGQLNVTSVTGTGGAILQPAGAGSTTELVFNPLTATGASIPSGWNYVVNVGAAGSTLSGADTAIIGAATSAGTYFVSGNSTVAAEGGNNTVSAGGNYLLSFGTGNNLVFAAGTGVIATDVGASTIVASSGYNVIEPGGTHDLVVALSGTTSMVTHADQLAILGAPTGAGSGSSNIIATLYGSQATISAGTSNVTASALGSVGK